MRKTQAVKKADYSRVTVSSGTIVAAGAVVHDSTEKNAIVAGVPARTIRVRK